MGRVSGSDYRAALEVLFAAGEVDRPVPFPGLVLEPLRKLVPCDVVAYHERPAPGEPAAAFAGEPLGAWQPGMREAEARYWHRDGLAPVRGARKTSDVLSRRAFHRLELYQEVARPIRAEFMMRLWLEPETGAGPRLELDRGDRDFGERDRAVLNLLLPHLTQLRRNADARRRIVERAGPLTPREREILELVAHGKSNAEVARTLWISPGTVRSISRTRTRSWASTAVRRPSPRCSAATARRPDGPTA